jgi:hypothetical protein
MIGFVASTHLTHGGAVSQLHPCLLCKSTCMTTIRTSVQLAGGREVWSKQCDTPSTFMHCLIGVVVGLIACILISTCTGSTGSFRATKKQVRLFALISRQFASLFHSQVQSRVVALVESEAEVGDVLYEANRLPVWVKQQKMFDSLTFLSVS